jgi:hypothetical protein
MALAYIQLLDFIAVIGNFLEVAGRKTEILGLFNGPVLGQEEWIIFALDLKRHSLAHGGEHQKTLEKSMRMMTVRHITRKNMIMFRVGDLGCGAMLTLAAGIIMETMAWN